MSSPPSEPPPPPSRPGDAAAPLAGIPPVKGWKVAATLIALIAGACVVCVVFALLYPQYISMRG